MKLFQLAVLTLVSHLALAQPPMALQVVTENFPPLQYLDNNQLKGSAVHLVRESLKEAGFENVDIFVLPWANAYRQAEQQENTLIFSMVRVPPREDKFKWVAEVGQMRIAVFKLKSRTDIQINSVEDLGNYSIASFIDSAPAHYLESKGIKLFANVGNADSLAPMLMRGRIDLVPSSEHNFIAMVSKAGYSIDDIEIAYYLEELDKGLWAAFNPDTDDELVERVRDAFAKVIAKEQDKVLNLPLPSQ